jgi:hypothetical protein
LRQRLKQKFISCTLTRRNNVWYGKAEEENGGGGRDRVREREREREREKMIILLSGKSAIRAVYV